MAKIRVPKDPKRMTITFTLYGSLAKRRSMYRWFRTLARTGYIDGEMEAMYETQTAFQSPEELAKRYDMKPDDFEETG